MAQATETFTLEAEAAGAFRVMDAYYRKQYQIGDAAERTGRKHKTSADMMNAYFSRAVKGVLAFGGSILSISKGLDILRQYEEHLNNIANKSNEIAGSAAGFIAMRGPEEAKRIAIQGAKYGMKPEESLPLAEIIYGAAAGDEAKAQEMFKTAADLKRLGVTQEGIQAVIKLSGDTRLGMSPDQVAALVYKAGEVSQATTAELAQVAGGVAQYSTPVMGASFLTAMSGVAEFTKEGIGQLAVYLEKAKLALSTKSDFRDSMVSYAKKKGMKWEDLDELQQAQLVKSRLDEKGMTYTIPSFEKLGLTEERQSRALSGVMGIIEKIEKAVPELSAVPADLVSGLVDAQMQDPMMKAAFQKAQKEAVSDVQDAYGVDAQIARETQARSDAVLLKMREQGGLIAWAGEKLPIVFSTLKGVMDSAPSSGPMGGIGGISNPPPPPEPRPKPTEEFGPIVLQILETLSEIKDYVAQTSINTGTSYEEVSVPGRNAGVE